MLKSLENPLPRILLSMLVLSFLLFLPGYFAVFRSHDFLPFFPDHHPRGVFDLSLLSLKEYILHLGLRRPNFDPFRLSGEVCFIMAAMWVLVRAGVRSKGLCLLATLATGLLLISEIYHAVLPIFVGRKANLAEDLVLARSAWHYLSGLSDVSLILKIFLGIIVFAMTITLVFSIYRVMENGMHKAKGTLAQHIVVLGFFVLPILSGLWFGLERDDPVIQWPAKRIAENYIRSQESLLILDRIPIKEKARELREMTSGIDLEKRPDVYLFVVESYGALLVDEPDLAQHFTKLMSSLEVRLLKDGWHAASRLSQAPVFGGGSWLSAATLQTGIWINSPLKYDYLATRFLDVYTITDAFKDLGYAAITVEPGTSDPQLPTDHLFRFDAHVVQYNMEYTGPEYGWGIIPDQYSLEYAYHNEMLTRDQPLFVQFRSVSSHIPWVSPPLVRDYKELNQKEVPPHINHRLMNYLEGDGDKIAFMNTLIYQWEIFSEFMSRVDDQSLFVVVGDHQPMIAGKTRHEAMVHVIAKDPYLMQKWISRDWKQGLIPDKKGGLFRHDDLLPEIFRTLFHPDDNPKLSRSSERIDGINEN